VCVCVCVCVCVSKYIGTLLTAQFFYKPKNAQNLKSIKKVKFSPFATFSSPFMPCYIIS
jgi:hypothetical protein